MFLVREVFGFRDLRDGSGMEGSGCCLAFTTLARTYQQTCITILFSSASGYVGLGARPGRNTMLKVRTWAVVHLIMQRGFGSCENITLTCNTLHCIASHVAAPTLC